MDLAAERIASVPLLTMCEAQEPGMCVSPTLSLESHRPAVFAVCLACTSSLHDADDLTQETFVRALSRMTTLHDPSKLRPWLLEIARNACIDYTRRRPQPGRALPPPAPDRDEERVSRLHAAIRKLPDDYREVIL